MKATKDGVGLLKVWKFQLQQLHNMSEDMAAAIASQFPSPLALKQVSSVFYLQLFLYFSSPFWGLVYTFFLYSVDIIIIIMIVIIFIHISSHGGKLNILYMCQRFTQQRWKL